MPDPQLWPVARVPLPSMPRCGEQVSSPRSGRAALLQHGSFPRPHGPMERCPAANVRPGKREKRGSGSSLGKKKGPFSALLARAVLVGECARLMHLSAILEDDGWPRHRLIGGGELTKMSLRPVPPRSGILEWDKEESGERRQLPVTQNRPLGPDAAIRVYILYRLYSVKLMTLVPMNTENVHKGSKPNMMKQSALSQCPLRNLTFQTIFNVCHSILFHLKVSKGLL